MPDFVKCGQNCPTVAMEMSRVSDDAALEQVTFHVFQIRWARNRCGQAWLVILTTSYYGFLGNTYNENTPMWYTQY